MLDILAEMHRENCDRCGNSTNNITTMSVFNEEVICMPCKTAEKNEPNYAQAVEAEMNAIRQGNYNFKGIGRTKIN